MPEWMTGWPFLIGMLVLLIVLIGVFFYLRRQPEDE